MRSNLEDERNKAVQDVKTITEEATTMRQRLDDAIKTADQHRRDHQATQLRMTDLQNVIPMKEGRDDNHAKQIEELQMNLLDAQDNWTRCESDAKTYMEIAQSRQTMIDELTVELKAMESLNRSAGQHDSDTMIMTLMPYMEI